MDAPASMRKDYHKRQLSEDSVTADPFQQFTIWWQQAVSAKIEEPNAMTLATASIDGLPAARTVLLKAFDVNGFVFFTNYDSNKGKQMQENPQACLLFFWKELERQVRITGIVIKTSTKESDEYFCSRPEGSRIGAWASPQSHVIENRQWLDDNEQAFRNKFGNEPPSRPENWGGYRVIPSVFEFWQGRSNRLHDRIQYSYNVNAWIIERLAP